MDRADRAVLSDLGQAVDLAEALPHEQAGVVVDISRLRWEPDVWHSIEKAGSYIPSSHVCDRTLPLRVDIVVSSADVRVPPRGRRRPRRRSDTGTLLSLRSDLRSTRDTTAAPARTNPASSGR